MTAELPPLKRKLAEEIYTELMSLIDAGTYDELEDDGSYKKGGDNVLKDTDRLLYLAHHEGLKFVKQKSGEYKLKPMTEEEKHQFRDDLIEKNIPIPDWNIPLHRLVASRNRGCYALGDSKTGHELTSGEGVVLRLNRRWIEGRIECSWSYGGPGCYAISNAGRKNYERQKNAPRSQSEESFQQQVSPAMQGGMSGQVSDLFNGYYFISKDGSSCGLCTGMELYLLSEWYRP